METTAVKELVCSSRMDILIVKLGALGDVINTLPLVRRIKIHFKANITWIVAPLSHPLVSNHPCVDHTVVFDKKKWASSILDVKAQLQSKYFDLSLDLQRTFKSASFCMLSKAKRRIGFDRKRCKDMSWIFPFERIPKSNPNAHMLMQYLEFADYLNVPTHDIKWEISASTKHPSALPQDYIVLNIGATKPVNRWTIDGFAALAGEIDQKFNLAAALTGGREDQDMADRIVDAAGHSVINLVGKTSIDELKNVLQCSRAVVTCDTGPMHLAVALGKEVIALFGPSDANRTGPFRGTVIQKAQNCSPCNKKKCKDPVCMEMISHEDVMRELERLMAS
jgi:lipopolysaccharide heptosyltransferase II